MELNDEKQAVERFFSATAYVWTGLLRDLYNEIPWKFFGRFSDTALNAEWLKRDKNVATMQH